MASLPTELSISSPTWAAAGLGMSGLFVYMARLYSQVRVRLEVQRSSPEINFLRFASTHPLPPVNRLFIARRWATAVGLTHRKLVRANSLVLWDTRRTTSDYGGISFCGPGDGDNHTTVGLNAHATRHFELGNI